MWKPLLRTLLLLTTVLYFGVKMPNVQAQTEGTCISHGNLIYEGKRGSAALYAADIHLLEEKISTIPEQCFDPAPEEPEAPDPPESEDAPDAVQEEELEYVLGNRFD